MERAHEHIDLDRNAADNVHYANDPRIRLLAQARWRMANGGTTWDWLNLGKDDPDNLIPEARDWVRAAVAAGILEPPKRHEVMDGMYEEMKAAREARPGQGAL
ncbi:hypothetical protein ACFQ6Q_00590 [Streptomyces sp. NPDC056437]|uniref:hypothetical protein n=1 Tax=Streptomyces sp. NPDC056437 TaxID=3345816 RepID=UPI0036839119